MVLIEIEEMFIWQRNWLKLINYYGVIMDTRFF